jgi:hypothetical protein
MAVTGRRTLFDEHAGEVAEEVKQALSEIQALVPHTGIRVVSNRLAARTRRG